MHRFKGLRPVRLLQGFALVALPALAVPQVVVVAGELGVRVGVGADGHDYNSREIYWRPAALAPRLGDRRGWHLAGFTEFNAARVSLGGDAMHTGGVSVGGWLTSPAQPISFGLGTGPTYISERRLGEREFGGHWQFTSHAALRLRLGDHISVGYRIQHTSNAGLRSPNQGYDVQSLELRLGF
ncbi:acyloxyacyl hydrolase [Aquisalimonas sp. 2447]|uniref:acyloxyacyl hydrolase n=1 Tax=Aquisalimonas sp. 2447 TaxID=2740807 RepID=UPI0014325D55|nr:acyloxyacyl hydrolase [Aquisalimonas sp. 2447]QIT56185.1 acyloxyacyl hydrolase [Aquisalimonas sp. 2447]